MVIKTVIAFSELPPCETWGAGGLSSAWPCSHEEVVCAPSGADTVVRRGLFPLEKSHNLSSLAHSVRIPWKTEFG